MTGPSKSHVFVSAGDVDLDGSLRVPDDPVGVVVFAHGSGSSRHSPRNNYVAEVLHERGLATLLFDLLTEQEDQTRENRFDIPLLTDRLAAATDWVAARDDTGALGRGYFGASTGAAAALRAAARRDDVGAIVSRGGRVDLAADRFDRVRAPTLLVVGSEDTDVLERNRDAVDRLDCEAQLEVVQGAGHLFEGSGQLEAVADAAAAWFASHLE
jgi:dienelactone hydrolase